MTKIRVEIEFKGPYDEEFEDDNKSWLCAENIRLVLIENTALTYDTVKVRELEEGG